jgi:hypothetical protein
MNWKSNYHCSPLKEKMQLRPQMMASEDGGGTTALIRGRAKKGDCMLP